MKKMLVLLLLQIFWTLGTESRGNSHVLKTRTDGSFKIVQFTDLHFGEDKDFDLRTMEIEKIILESEKPDFVVITGDLVSGNELYEGGFEDKWLKLTQPMKELNISWALALGNHDYTDLTRDQIVLLDQTENLSFTQRDGSTIPGVVNYRIPVYHHHTSMAVAHLWIFDSLGHHAGCYQVQGYDCVGVDQISWFVNKVRHLSNISELAPGLAFFHIPIPEFITLWNTQTTYGNCNEPICCSSVNTGLFSAMLKTNSIVSVHVGHDHSNDFYGNLNGIQMAYGRKTGVASYGPDGLSRGARVIELQSEPFSITTWITDENGIKLENPQPHFPNPFSQFYACCDTVGSNFPSMVNIFVGALSAISAVFGGFLLWFIAIYRKLERFRKGKEDSTKIEMIDVIN